MENNLTVKTVPFAGTDLIAAKDETTGKIHVGVSYVCNGIGLSEKQKDNEVSKIQRDLVLKRGANKLPLKFEGQVREALCLDIEFLPLWLAKISITPAMQAERPDVVDVLMKYQLEAKDVLAEAFIKNNKPKTAKQETLRLGEMNALTRLLMPIYNASGMAPQFQAAAVKNLYAQVGIDIPTEGITLNKRLLDVTAIAKRLGILSSSGNPHIQAVSAIISQLDILPEEKELASFQNAVSGHAGTNWQYAESVVIKVEQWLIANRRPTAILAGGKTYKVTYAS